nr:unnamed protein product [Callosobruchus chinensis]
MAAILFFVKLMHECCTNLAIATYVEALQTQNKSHSIAKHVDYKVMSAVRLRRAKKLNSPDTLYTTTQEQFLNNEKNKARLIDLIKVAFSSSGISVKQADGDANLLIVQTVLDISTNQEPAVIVVEDFDLLVILSSNADISHANAFFMKPGRGKSQPQEFQQQA